MMGWGNVFHGVLRIDLAFEYEHYSNNYTYFSETMGSTLLQGRQIQNSESE